jgi:hypothetical protein
MDAATKKAMADTIVGVPNATLYIQNLNEKCRKKGNRQFK